MLHLEEVEKPGFSGPDRWCSGPSPPAFCSEGTCTSPNHGQESSAPSAPVMTSNDPPILDHGLLGTPDKAWERLRPQGGVIVSARELTTLRESAWPGRDSSGSNLRDHKRAGCGSGFTACRVPSDTPAPAMNMRKPPLGRLTLTQRQTGTLDLTFQNGPETP